MPRLGLNQQGSGDVNKDNALTIGALASVDIRTALVAACWAQMRHLHWMDQSLSPQYVQLDLTRALLTPLKWNSVLWQDQQRPETCPGVVHTCGAIREKISPRITNRQS